MRKKNSLRLLIIIWGSVAYSYIVRYYLPAVIAGEQETIGLLFPLLFIVPLLIGSLLALINVGFAVKPDWSRLTALVILMAGVYLVAAVYLHSWIYMTWIPPVIFAPAGYYLAYFFLKGK